MAQAFQPNSSPPGIDPWWRSVAAITISLVLAAAILAFVTLVARPLAILALAVAVASSLAPVVTWLERRMPRPLAVILIFLVLILIVVAIGAIVIPPLFTQAREASTRLPAIIEQLEEWFDQWSQAGENPLINTLFSQAGGFGESLLTLPFGLFSSLFELVLMLFISLYLLVEAPNMRRFVLSLLPTENRPKADDVLQKMAAAMGGYVRGVVIIGFIVGVATYLGLLVIGVDYPLVLGLLAGVLELIPVLGPIIAAVPMLLLALTISPTTALIVLVYVTILQQVESNILVPNIMRTQTEVSPLLAILAIFAGGAVGGILGAVIAIPLAAALRVFAREVLAPAIRKRTGAEPHELSDKDEPD